MSEDAKRTLILMRHAKSAYPPGVDDHQRPLNLRGTRQATQAGTWLQDNFNRIDAVLCSTATRTRATLTQTGVHSQLVRFSDKLYDSTVGITLGEINGVPDSATTVLVVGHEPTTSQLALALADTGNAEAANRISTKFPTSAIAVLTTRSPWSRLELAGGSLTKFHVPR
ncbi:SixA phosphatase family protein [Mycobacteroides salmoniphilum]|uniref:SixA phosphatase family protein n=1 Tax=Mycobacteroides salmoniphilum TaxID=404941 RepID=UPI001065C1C1|nr:histidine phosphatase family protein [Mycobacteroides salmoniphilum]TDZ81332.1 phosphohistidine phosphatase [Mycobacteroides salmoniphilum]TDZ88832.1 phosphohistidine phosphatase [Mycobacteroides salmoniphilum]